MSTLDRLIELNNVYLRDARRCTKAKAYLAATVMEVAALEAALLGMCFLFPKQVKASKVYQQKRFRSKRCRFLEFSLYQLIAIANELSWFPPRRTTWAGKRANVGGFANEIRKIRNLVHPGEYARRKWSDLRFTKGIHGVVEEVSEVAVSWLGNPVEQKLQRAMEREERRKTK